MSRRRIRRRKAGPGPLRRRWFWRPLIGTFLAVAAVVLVLRGTMDPDGFEPRHVLWALLFAALYVAMEFVTRIRGRNA